MLILAMLPQKYLDLFHLKELIFMNNTQQLNLLEAGKLVFIRASSSVSLNLMLVLDMSRF